jgi:hypothetical protein
MSLMGKPYPKYAEGYDFDTNSLAYAKYGAWTADSV